MIWLGYGYDCESINAGEVPRVARVDRYVGRHGDGGDHCVIGPCGRLASGLMQGRDDPAETTSSGRIKGERVEIGFRLLDVRLAGSPFVGC